MKAFPVSASGAIWRATRKRPSQCIGQVLILPYSYTFQLSPPTATSSNLQLLSAMLPNFQIARFVGTSTSDGKNELYAELDREDQKMLNKLIEYKAKHGDCHVPSGKGKFSDLERERLGVSADLASWVTHQRQLYSRANKNSKASFNMSKQLQVKILVLDSMGFMWSALEAQWQRSFNRLEAFAKKQHQGGLLKINKEDNPQLNTWMDEQRRRYQKGKLSDERYALLKEIGFEFDLYEAKWWDYYNRLCQYKAKYGDTLVPADFADDTSLGMWVFRQRRRYTQNQLADDKIETLENVGFCWSIREDTWEENYKKLQEFYQQHGHVRVTRETGPLWAWVQRQRGLLRSVGDELDDGQKSGLKKMGLEEEEEESDDIASVGSSYVVEDRVKRLVDLTVAAGVQDHVWMTSFRKLCNFKELVGHFSIPHNDPEHSELSNWMRQQRYLYKRGKLPDDRVAALEGIDFEWSGRQARWERMYEELVRFRSEHGHTRVPTKNAALYRWTVQQRKALESMLKEGATEKMDHRFAALEKILVD